MSYSLNNTQNQDYFTNLPNELLEKIFNKLNYENTEVFPIYDDMINNIINNNYNYIESGETILNLMKVCRKFYNYFRINKENKILIIDHILIRRITNHSFKLIKETFCENKTIYNYDEIYRQLKKYLYNNVQFPKLLFANILTYHNFTKDIEDEIKIDIREDCYDLLREFIRSNLNISNKKDSEIYFLINDINKSIIDNYKLYHNL